MLTMQVSLKKKVLTQTKDEDEDMHNTGVNIEGMTVLT